MLKMCWQIRPDVVWLNRTKGNGLGNWAQRRFDFSVNRIKKPDSKTERNLETIPVFIRKRRGRVQWTILSPQDCSSALPWITFKINQRSCPGKYAKQPERYVTELGHDPKNRKEKSESKTGWIKHNRFTGIALRRAKQIQQRKRNIEFDAGIRNVGVCFWNDCPKQKSCLAACTASTGLIFPAGKIASLQILRPEFLTQAKSEGMAVEGDVSHST